MTIAEALDKRDLSYTKIADAAGVSRQTVGNVRKDPDRATLGTLRKIFRAMGYKIVLSLEKIEGI